MTRRQTRKEQRSDKARGELAAGGVTAVAAGIAMLTFLPALMHTPVTAALLPMLRPVGLSAIGVGALLLGLHFVTKRRNAPIAVDAVEPAFTSKPARKAPVAVAPNGVAPASVSGLESTFAPEEQLAHLLQDRWSPAVFAAIEWRRFEALCEAFYAQVGLETRTQSHGADGGVDIWLHSKHMPEPRIVQCKHWKTKPVGVKELREFRGVMAANQLKHGTYVTSSTFTAEAAAFAKSNRIQTQDGAALLKLIGQRTPEQQQALLAVAYEGEYWRPTCASCGVKMVERKSNVGKKPFWGCANFPSCRGKAIAKAA